MHGHYHLNVELNLNKVIGLILLFQEADAIKVVVDQLFRSIHFLPIQDTQNIERSTQHSYIRDIDQG